MIIQHHDNQKNIIIISYVKAPFFLITMHTSARKKSSADIHRLPAPHKSKISDSIELIVLLPQKFSSLEHPEEKRPSINAKEKARNVRVDMRCLDC